MKTWDKMVLLGIDPGSTIFLHLWGRGVSFETALKGKGSIWNSTSKGVFQKFQLSFCDASLSRKLACSDWYSFSDAAFGENLMCWDIDNTRWWILCGRELWWLWRVFHALPVTQETCWIWEMHSNNREYSLLAKEKIDTESPAERLMLVLFTAL